MEQWKDIKGYEGIYQISNYGRIKSLARKVGSRNGALKPLPEKIVKPLYTKAGYLNLVASKKQVRETLVVHHLVAKYFIGERPEGLVIDHIDGNITNNHVSNLKYVTNKENLRKRHDIKLDEKKVREIWGLIGEGKPQGLIAQMYGITQPMVSGIKTGRAWTDVKEERERA